MTDRMQGRGTARAAAILSGLMGLVLTVMASAADAPLRSRAAELGALAAILFAPFLIGMAGRWRESGTLFAAGVVALPLTLVSFAGVGLPYLIAAILCFVAAGRSRDVRTWHLPMGLAMAALVVAAFFALFASTDQVCWTKERSPDGSVRSTYERAPYEGSGMISLSGDEVSAGCTETPSYRSALVSLTLSTTAIVGGSGAIKALARRRSAAAEA